ncbi:MAG: hypothetical protein Fur0016_01370 [Anaerolineales bacterium]
MKRKILLGLAAAGIFLAAVVFFYYRGRPVPVEMREEIYPCVVYYRKMHVLPRTMIAHIVTVDLTCKNIRVLVTPPEKGDKDTPLRARTTKQFADEFGVQIAINGDGFTPWWSNSLFDYYPKPGDPVRPLGLAASNGRQYGTYTPKSPVLYINERKEASFGTSIRKVYTAISGMIWLVRDRQVVEDLNDTRSAPRTAVGLDGPGTRLILIVVDGRQPFYSEGATIAELAELMLFYGGDNAIMLDGGGSSTMVINWPGKGLQVMNSPIDLGIPGRERAVGNHLGIFAVP